MYLQIVAHQIWYCSSWKACNWNLVPGGLVQISSYSSAPGIGVVCGVNSADNIWCSDFTGPQVSWVQLPGALVNVKVNPDGSLYGVNRGNQVWHCSSWKSCNWVNIPGTLTQIFSTSASTVCGVNSVSPSNPAANIWCSGV